MAVAGEWQSLENGSWRMAGAGWRWRMVAAGDWEGAGDWWALETTILQRLDFSGP